MGGADLERLADLRLHGGDIARPGDRRPASVSSPTTGYTFTGLKNGTAYSVRVRAHNKAPDPSAGAPSSAADGPGTRAGRTGGHGDADRLGRSAGSS